MTEAGDGRMVAPGVERGGGTVAQCNLMQSDFSPGRAGFEDGSRSRPFALQREVAMSQMSQNDMDSHQHPKGSKVLRHSQRISS